MRLALVLLLACGSREKTAPIDYGPPPQPQDPISCPAELLERFAARIGATISITTAPMVEASRVDKVPCKPGETDAACIARARQRPVHNYEVTTVKIGDDSKRIEYEYDIDGHRMIGHADTAAKMVERIKALQAKGHKVTLIRGESAPDAGSRHAAITYRGLGLRERRIATLRHTGRDVMSGTGDLRELAAADRLDIRSIDVDDKGDLVILVTCL